MSYLPMPRDLDLITFSRDHRLFEPINNFCVMHACIAQASRAYHGQPEFNLGDYAILPCKHNDLQIRLPLGYVFEIALQGKKPGQLQIGVEAKQPPFMTGPGGKGFAAIMRNLISPVFIAFFEDHKVPVYTRYGNNSEDWPQTLAFARLVRGALAHEGKLNLRGKRITPTEWRGLTYSHDNDEREIIGTDINVADMLLLMLDMNDELDLLIQTS